MVKTRDLLEASMKAVGKKGRLVAAKALGSRQVGTPSNEHTCTALDNCAQRPSNPVERVGREVQ
jgi:hypothetical protein